MEYKKTNTLLNILSNVFTLVIVLIAGLLVGTRLIGYTPYAIISGSMEPDYKVGSLVYVSKVDPYDISINSVITYVLNEEGVVSTHRVVGIDKENQQFITKGDANKNIDSLPVHFNNVLGEVKFSIPYLGFVSVFINSRNGLIIIIALLGVLLVSSVVSKVMKKPNIKEKENYHEKIKQ